MFKIIGADQKEYGPISAEQMKQWIAEGRANSATLVQAAGSTDWKPLSSFPDFTVSTPLSPYSAPPVLASNDERKSKLAAGLLGIFLGGFGVHRFYLGYTTMGVIQIVVSAAHLRHRFSLGIRGRNFNSGRNHHHHRCARPSAERLS